MPTAASNLPSLPALEDLYPLSPAEQEFADQLRAGGGGDGVVAHEIASGRRGLARWKRHVGDGPVGDPTQPNKGVYAPEDPFEFGSNGRQSMEFWG